MRVAIVHDWLNQRGGAEEVLEVLRSMFPAAPVFTSIFIPQVMPSEYRTWPIRTSFMQRLPAVNRYHRALLPLFPLAFRAFDLSGYDLVISNSSGFCHGVATRSPTCHVNYCLTPPRYVWSLEQYMAREQIGGAARAMLPLAASFLRRWDFRAAQAIDHFIGISRTVQDRIRQFYGRESAVIHPPVNTGVFSIATGPGDYYLVVSRLAPYKRIDLAVAAFSKMGLPLIIVGAGRDRPNLERIASSNVSFLGWQPRERMRELLAGCRAFIFPGEEDFGIAPVEAQASGRPVIAYAGGGALETVEDGVSGLFFREATPESLAEAVTSFEREKGQFDSAVIQEVARRFDTAVFIEKLAAFIDEKMPAGVRSARVRNA